MPDLRLAAFGPDDRDDIETRGRLRNAVAGEVMLAGFGELVALGVADLKLRRRLIIFAGLDLDEYQRLTIARDDVDFTKRTAVVAHDNLVAEIAKIPSGHILAAVPQRITW